ncbi:MAG: hypothetical protein ACFFBT_04655 [Promethearchaeota archaeon]
MAKTVIKTNWDKFEQQGKKDGELQQEFGLLFTFYTEYLPVNVFEEDSDQFTKEFIQELEKKYDEICAKFPQLPQKQKTHWKNKTSLQLREHLDLLINKKALCTIEFDSYSIHKFFEALKSIVEEVVFEIKQEKIVITLTDDNVISLAEVSLKNRSYIFYREGNLALNIEDLDNLIKASDKDNAHTTLIFGEDKLFITITSKKYKTSPKRTLEHLDIDKQDITALNLHEIEYPCKFEITKELLEYIIINSGKYSDIIGIECTPEQLTFSEMGQIGEGTIPFKRKAINLIEFFDELVEKDQEIRQKEYFGLEYFKTVKKLASILAHNDPIQFFLKHDHPLKSVIEFKRLEDTSITFYFAPRANNNENEEDLDEFQEEEEDF